MRIIDSEPPVLAGTISDPEWWYGVETKTKPDGIEEITVLTIVNAGGELVTDVEAAGLERFVAIADADFREANAIKNDTSLRHDLLVFKGHYLPYGGKEKPVEEGVFLRESGDIHPDFLLNEDRWGEARYFGSRSVPTEFFIGKFVVGRFSSWNTRFMNLQARSRRIGRLQFSPGDVVRTKSGETMHRTPERAIAYRRRHPYFMNDILVTDDVTVVM